MKRSEVAMLLTMAKATDDRVTVDEGRVEAWHWTLDQDMDYEFAKAAMLKHYAHHTDPVMPADINDLWRIERDYRRTKAEQQAWREQQKQLESAAVDARPYIESIMEQLTGISGEKRRAALSIRCPHCGAPKGQRCLGIDGRTLTRTYAHAVRFEEVGVEAPTTAKEALDG
jgi:hypothetical protein